MDVVYHVVYKSNIDLMLRVLNGSTDLEQDESLNLDAFTQDAVNYFDYQWTCGGFFQRYCNLYNGSRFVEISYSAFILLGGIAETEYTFSVTVWN